MKHAKTINIHDVMADIRSREVNAANVYGGRVPLHISMQDTRAITQHTLALEAERDELIQALEELVGRHCGDRTDASYVDSHGDQASADAIRVLAKHGKVQITDELRHAVIGRWVA